MVDKTSDLKRREFLKTGVLASAGAATIGGSLTARPVSTQAAEGTGTIPQKKFGKTGWTLPILGMGGSAMVQRFIQAYGVPLLGEEERVAMVRHAYDQGVRYFDTARVYGESEKIMGKGLKGVRDKVYLATKVADPRPAKTRESIERSLKELDMDYVDCAQVHSPAIERVGFEGAMKIHAELLN